MDNKPPLPVGAGDVGERTWSDGPTIVAELDTRTMSVDESFRTYFMYRPKEAGAIRVTIGRLDWCWRAKAIRVRPNSNRPGMPPDPELWQIVGSPEQSSNPRGVPTTELPVWTHHAFEIPPSFEAPTGQALQKPEPKKR